jgi:putative flippase GtrA
MRSQLLRFVVAGVVGFVVDAGILYLALALGMGFFFGRVVSFLCAVWTTWRINRSYTFAGHREQSVWAEWWRYLTAMSLGGLVNYAAYTVAVVSLRGYPFLPVIAVAIGSVAGLAVNFISAKLWVFRQR